MRRILVSLFLSPGLLLLAGANGCSPAARQEAAAPERASDTGTMPAGNEAPRPAQPTVIVLRKADVEPLLRPGLTATQAKDLAGVLDGVSVDHIELGPDDKGRGELVSRQERTFFVNPVALPGARAVDLRWGLTAEEAAGRRAERLFGLPGDVRTADELRRWLAEHPRDLQALSVGSRPDEATSLVGLVGLYRLESHPRQVRCETGPATGAGVVPFRLTVEYFKLPVEFRYARDPSAADVTIVGIDRVDGLPWPAFVRQHFGSRPAQGE